MLPELFHLYIIYPPAVIIVGEPVVVNVVNVSE
jgi:hypothetical protein